ncbi:homoserine O-acetyltransferase MetA [Ferrimonas balearica]|uniref:homoserine O-acetyltransferase MetA n=1 Tax=Ferrimonas balearica TaxID=44012 RepID=UPI001F2F23D3|nr:homoserine O-succinyltransferase [Ferrimonas balearica]MBY6018217.1 homoserine O-succinyltransferase [Halomonas denitrificans]MBY6094557.1 homoserine O-succinyltransferase [Ferrimonas balearica]
MPVKVPDSLPASAILRGENIFVMSETRAEAQNIRPLKLLILNLMPNKIETETQLLRLLGNSPLQVDVELLRIHNRPSKHTPCDHMNAFYRDFEQVRGNNYDGLIITGAPLGDLEFEEVAYWDEIRAIIDWSQQHATSVLFLCWAAHAAFYHLYGIKRYLREEKISGVFQHRRVHEHVPLLRGFDDEFWVPHSRYAQVSLDQLKAHGALKVLAESDEAGAYLVVDQNNRNLFVTGHPEYTRTTLQDEYRRDLAAGLTPKVPNHYYPDNDPTRPPRASWHAHGALLFSNWLNYYVYQQTPFDLNDMAGMTPWE